MADTGRIQHKDISDCSDIGKLFKDSLPETFPVSFVCDSEVKPKAQKKSLARSSLPPDLFLMPSALGDGRLGVYTTNTIEGRVIFGPFKGKEISTPDVANEADYSNLWDVINFESTLGCFTVDGSNEWSSNWMRFVNCARNENEQNLVSFQHCGDIYYRTCKTIDSGSELLVWFDDLFYSKKPSTKQDSAVSKSCSGGHHFHCENCKLVFLGPSYLYRHKEHRCPSRLSPNQADVDGATTPCCAADDIARSSDGSVNTQGNSVTPQASEEKRYQCSKCDKCFASAKFLLKHFGSHTAELPYKCWVCDEGFVDFQSRRDHVEKHNVRNNLRCPECRRNFDEITALQSHPCLGVNDNPKKFKCYQCEKTFSNKDYLVNHLSTHSEVKLFSCDLCHKQFTKRLALSRHKKRLHRSNANKKESPCCKVCGKVFSDTSSLKMHQRVHTGEKPYKCKQCGNCFAQASTLASHLRTHTKDQPDKPFKCADCGKCFVRVADFHIHEKMHSGEKPYKCNQCDKCFALRYSLTKHRLVHLSEKQKVEESLAGRLRLWKCAECDKMFTKRSNLQRHERTHKKRYKCTNCNRRFSRKEDLTLHSEVHTSEKHECWVCGKVLSSYDNMKLHICVHTGERPHSCPVCGKGYISLTGYKAHLSSHK